MPSLTDVDLSLALSKKEEARRLKVAQERLLLLRLFLRRPALQCRQARPPGVRRL